VHNDNSAINRPPFQDSKPSLTQLTNADYTTMRLIVSQVAASKLCLLALLVVVVLVWSSTASSASHDDDDYKKRCPCKLEKRPDIFDKAQTARYDKPVFKDFVTVSGAFPLGPLSVPCIDYWNLKFFRFDPSHDVSSSCCGRTFPSFKNRWMAHSLNWGVVSTISSRLPSTGDGSDGRRSGRSSLPAPFGNIYSFVDGPCHQSTGIPYIYSTYLDQSMLDAKENPMVSLSLSEATLSSACSSSSRSSNSHEDVSLDACTVGTKYGDPEMPICARLVLTGALVVLNDKDDKDEYFMAREALFERHASMASWPSDHNWVIAKIDVQDVWLIDYFGGATILSLDDYFGAAPFKDNNNKEEELH
jgi:hypothetical protein